MPTPECHEKRKLDRLIDRLNDKLPDRISNIVGWLVSPSGMLIRLPLGLMLIVGGFFSFLPLLGFWMLPLGILLIAVDVPPVRRWVIRTWPKIEARWRLYRQRKARASGSDDSSGSV
ncbi:MAG TPA: hypothetical protein PLD46_01540 [Hyphomicrobium sp.]|nr:hypothetical protein [Hyphomicrobium sp.]